MTDFKSLSNKLYLIFINYDIMQYDLINFIQKGGSLL